MRKLTVVKSHSLIGYLAALLTVTGLALSAAASHRAGAGCAECGGAPNAGQAAAEADPKTRTAGRGEASSVSTDSYTFKDYTIKLGSGEVAGTFRNDRVTLYHDSTTGKAWALWTYEKQSHGWWAVDNEVRRDAVPFTYVFSDSSGVEWFRIEGRQYFWCNASKNGSGSIRYDMPVGAYQRITKARRIVGNNNWQRCGNDDP